MHKKPTRAFHLAKLGVFTNFANHSVLWGMPYQTINASNTMTSKEIREAFKDFFRDKGHRIASAPMVIKDDPTLMFTNAGEPVQRHYTRQPQG